MLSRLRMFRWIRPAAALLFALACDSSDTGTEPPVDVTSVVVNGETVVPARAKISLTAEARSASGSAVNAGSVSWSSSDWEIASVSGSGEVQGLSLGTVTITATIADVTGSLDVTVDLADLTAMVDSIDRAHGLPAMGGAIVTSRGLIGIGVAGDRRIGGPPATVEDCWHIGSNMKAVTAFMAAVAVNDGILDWSRRVPEAFPEIEVREEYRDVTLRDLVTNQSGLPAHFSGPLQAQDARGQRDEVAAWAFVQVPAAERGDYSYSNIGFAMAGAMLERAYGEAFESLIQFRLFDPLGLDEVGWGPQTEPGASDNPVPHSWGGNGWEPCEGCDNPPWVGPAGRMHLPLGEWARIIQELLRAKEGDSDLISRSAGQLLSTGVVPINDNWDYGYGWIVRPWDWVGDDVLWHGGCNGYNYSQALVAPTPDFAILTVTNAGDLSERRDRFPVNELVDRMLLYYASGQ